MGARERWVDDEEAEANGQVAAAVLKSVRDTPGAIVSGKAHTWTAFLPPPTFLAENVRNPNASRKFDGYTE